MNGIDVRYEYDESNRPKKISANRTGSVVQLLYKYDAFVGEKLEKYQSQLLLLKFCLCFFHAIPQMIVQIDVYMHDTHGIYDDSVHLNVFYVSMATSAVLICQFLHECTLTRKRHLIEIFY